MRHLSVATIAALALLLVGSLVPASAEDDIRKERVQFKRGAESAVIEDSITGYDIVDYLLGAKAGQAMSVSLSTDNNANYFNVMAPGETELAMFVGSISGNEFEAVLPADGDYTLRVYLMRNAARRNEMANYRLEMNISAGTRGANEPELDSATILPPPPPRHETIIEIAKARL